ncbi:MAG: glycosyltransferase family 39 protein [Candidatus Eisenbacteria bacterium]|nr:glycosyltransferase family 39 protein [Candidatus Eisenbacteria bacterium]
MTPPAARPPGGPPRWAWWAVLAVALAARLALVLVTPREILWPDGSEFEAVARSLLGHQGYGLQTLRPPGYPTFIALVYALLGPGLIGLRIVEACVGTAAVGVIGLVGASLFGPLAGFVAMAIAAVHPVLAFLPSTQFSENLLVFAVVLALWAAFGAWRRGGLARWALAGALFGVCTLIRPNVVLMLPGLGLGFALALRQQRRAWLAPAAVCALALALTVTPWVVRNHHVHHRWYFVATGGGRQFWFGNNPAASGATASLMLPDSAMQAEIGRLPDDAARERFLYRRGLSFVREHPGRAFQLYLVKLGNLFALFPQTCSRTAFLTPPSQAAQAAASLLVFLGVLLALRRLRRTPALWPMAGAIVSFALTNAVFFTVMRYRMAFEPCLLWMAGAGWVWTLGRGKGGEVNR